MQPRAHRTSFGVLSAGAVLTACGVVLFMLARWLVPLVFDGSVHTSHAVMMASVVAWAASVAGIVPLALGNGTIMRSVYRYFFGAATRVAICVVATIFAIGWWDLAPGPWAVTLVGMYLPMLYLEVMLVSRYLLRSDHGQKTNPGPRPSCNPEAVA